VTVSRIDRESRERGKVVVVTAGGVGTVGTIVVIVVVAVSCNVFRNCLYEYQSADLHVLCKVILYIFFSTIVYQTYR
jgi:hypothetical protein